MSVSFRTKSPCQSLKSQSSYSQFSNIELFQTKFASIDNTIDGFLANPIQSGYLLKFSQSEYNAENMIYILEIERFKDLCQDSKAWDNHISYKSIDINIDSFHSVKPSEDKMVFGIRPDREWPSKRIPFASFREHAKKIWDTYLGSAAAQQICIPARVLSNTIHRLRYLDLYGPHVFDETLIDPVKTLNTDVRPRFLTSPHYNMMKWRLSSIYPLPTRNDFHVILPRKSACMEWPENRLTLENLRSVPMVDLFQDRILYDEFLKYSKKIYADENVYFCRRIQIFRTMCAATDLALLEQGKMSDEANDQAWFIFRYFIIPDSVFAVSGVMPLRMKGIMRDLAHPHPKMFEHEQLEMHRFIQNQYINFSFTKEFENIPFMIKNMQTQNVIIAESTCITKHFLVRNNCQKLISPHLTPQQSTGSVTYT